jgi:hypothetical protein
MLLKFDKMENLQNLKSELEAIELEERLEMVSIFKFNCECGGSINVE